MRAKKLSPLDLGDVFAFGDAGVYDKVPLSHVCEVMFDLDPDCTDGANPVSERMEEFLYEHSYEDKGEIVVDIKEALRALDIWQGGHPSSSSLSVASAAGIRPKTALGSRTRAVLLESKNKRLEEVVSTIQRENVRLSQELQAFRDLRKDPETSSSARTSRPEPSTKIQPRSSSVSLPTKPTTVFFEPEDELVLLANALTYSGVKTLEQELAQLDKGATGFVSLKQLRWLLDDHFGVETSETRLLEMCLGMSFNPQAQLDYKELVTALLDILIYAAPALAASKKSDALSRFDKYLASGFPPDRLEVRRLVEQLCRKYDAESSGRIALVELLRVLRCDLVEEHALRLEFPLNEKETIQLVLSTTVWPFGTRGDAAEALVYYEEVLDALFGGVCTGEAPSEEHGARLKQALNWGFWERIRKTLCNGSRAKEASVLAQILKIVRKLDRGTSFTVSLLFFKRIFDQHLRAEDVYVLSRALQTPEIAVHKGQRHGNTLRYDVFLFLTFGAPRIEQDVRGKDPFVAGLRSRLAQNERALRKDIADVMKTHGADWRLGLEQFCALVGPASDREPLATVELLFLFAALSAPDDSVARVEVITLWDFLVGECGCKSVSSEPLRAEKAPLRSPESPLPLEDEGGSSERAFIRDLIVQCLNDYNLERVLAPYKQQHRGWVAIPKLLGEILQMLRGMGVSDRYASEKELVRDVGTFLARIADQASKVGTHSKHEKAPFPNAISLHDFFESVFDWRSVARALRLPQNLAEVDRLLRVFDWDKNGTIQCDDWNKAWRQMCLGQAGMYEWEIRVLQRRFPGALASSASLKKTSASMDGRVSSLWNESIDYSRMLEFLVHQEQHDARDALCRHAIAVLRRETASNAGGISTFRLEKLFRSLDQDGKGFFNARDLVAFLTNERSSDGSNTETDERRDGDSRVVLKLLENRDAVEFAMKFLSSGATLRPTGPMTKAKPDSGTSDDHKAVVVTYDQFRHLVINFTIDSRGGAVDAAPFSPTPAPPQPRQGSVVVASLRSLELSLLEIARDVSRANGQIVPRRAFRYLSQGAVERRDRHGSGRSSSPPRSPMRRDELSSPIKYRQRELYASSTDPLTPERLKRVLQRHHRLTASTHLIGQFFVHAGAASKHFLELNEFSRWAAPLAVEMQAKVREVVRKMVVKGKGGGGKVDLDRFLAQLERRLADSPIYSSGGTASLVSSSGRQLPPRVPVSLLLSKLHQLNIPLSRSDFTALIRHFGMDDDDEYVDYTLFLQRMFETSIVGQV